MTGQQFKQRRLGMALRQSDLGSLLGMSAKAISRIEAGQKGRKPTKVHIAAMDMLWFIHRKDLLHMYSKLVEFKKEVEEEDLQMRQIDRGILPLV